MKTQHKIKAGNYHTKKKWNRKNQKRHQQIAKHFSKRSKKKEVWKIETQRKVEELYKVHLEIAKHYEQTRPDGKDTRPLEIRAAEKRRQKVKGSSQMDLEIAWGRFERFQRDKIKSKRKVLQQHTAGEML